MTRCSRRTRHTSRGARWAAVAALITPGLAHATDMGGLGVVVAAMFVGLPGALVIVALIVTSVVLGLQKDARPWRRAYAWCAIALTLLLLGAFPVAALVLSQGSPMVGVTALFTAPLGVLALGSVLLAVRVLRRNRA